jgi:hypothetical protein
MKVIYGTIVGGTPLVIPLNPEATGVFNVSIRTDATTVEFALERPDDSTARNSFVTAVGTAPTWLAAPAAANGIVNITFPVSAIRLSKATAGVATVLQAGI